MADEQRPGEGSSPAGGPEPAATTDDPGVVPPDEGRGAGIVRLSWAGTAVYALVAAAATIWPDPFKLSLVVVCGVLFVAGLVTFTLAFLVAVNRSREDAIGMGGLFFLAGCAPARVRALLVGSFVAEAVVATVTASIGLARLPGTETNPLAFGFLTPLYGLGLAGWWGARYGVFPPRQPGRARPPGPSTGRDGARGAR